MSTKTVLKNKCSGCGSELSFNPKEKSLTCSHCENKLPIEEDLADDFKRPLLPDSVQEDYNDNNTQYYCSHCDKRYSHHREDELKACPSCGSSELRKTFDIIYNPDAIIPFRIDMHEAAQTFSKWLSKKWFCPNDLKKIAKLEKLQSVYYPAWNFDSSIHTTYSGIGVNTTIKNGKTETTRRRFSGNKTTQYDNFIEYASPQTNSLSSAMKMGNFGFNKMMKFRPEYLYGFDAHETKYSLHEGWSLAEKNITEEEIKRIKSSLGYDRIENFKSTSSFSNKKYGFMYVPLFELNYKYKEELYSCYINGYSGQVNGKVPRSAVKITFLVLSILLVIGGIYALYTFL